MKDNMKPRKLVRGIALALLGGCTLNAYGATWTVVNDDYGPAPRVTMDENWDVPGNAGWNDPVYVDDGTDAYAEVTSKSWQSLVFINASANAQGRTWEFRARASNHHSLLDNNRIGLRLNNERIFVPAGKGTGDSIDFTVNIDDVNKEIYARDRSGAGATIPVDTTVFQTYRFVLTWEGHVYFQHIESGAQLEVQARTDRAGDGFGPWYGAGGNNIDWHFDYMRVSTQPLGEPMPVPDNEVPMQIHRAVELFFDSEAGKFYQVQASSDMQTWENASDLIEGTGEEITWLLSIRGTDREFYRLMATD